MQHQAQGLQRQFAGHAAGIVSVLAGPSALPSHEVVLALADELARNAQRVWLVGSAGSELAASAGCRPLLSWRTGRPAGEQLIKMGRYALLHAPHVLAGEKALVREVTAGRDCDCLLFDGGRFVPEHAPIEPSTLQTLVVLLGKDDAEPAYALIKALHLQRSPASVVLLGEAAFRVAQTATNFLGATLESQKSKAGLYQNGNKQPETSSITLSIAPNLAWVVSRIMQNDQHKVAHGGIGKGAEQINER